MATPDAQHDGIIVDERGVTLTPEGRARARAKLAEAAAKHTPERRERLRKLLGIPADR